MKNIRFLFYTLILLHSGIYSQLPDSLNSKLRSIYSIKDNKSKAKELEYFTKSHLFKDLSVSIKNSKELIRLAKLNKDEKALATAFNVRGLTEIYSDNNDLGIAYFDSSRKICIKLNDSLTMAKVEGNTGIAYENKNDYENAYKYYLASLKINEKRNQLELTGSSYGNLGNVLIRLNRYEDAISYFKKSIHVFNELKKAIPLANQYNSLSQAYDGLNDTKNQRFYLNKAKEIYEQENDAFHLGTIYSNLCNIEYQEKNYNKALEYVKKGIAYDKFIGDTNGLAILYTNYVNVLIHMNKHKEAMTFVDSAYALINEIKDNKLLYAMKKNHARILAQFNNYEEAHDLLSQAIAMQEELSGEFAQKAIAELEQKYQSEKKQFEIEQLQKNKKINELKLEQNKSTIAKQNAQRNLIIGILISVLIVLGLLTQSFRQKKKSNVILANKNEIIEKNNFELTKAYDEIKIQKEEISEKNKEILDSIYYAQRIQSALLSNTDFIKKHLNNHFIFFKPKDIVSGDFYWATYIKPKGNENGKFFLAVCDCTGHGVPGAFMSLLNISFLNEAINEKNIHEPHLIFNFVRDRLISNISSEGQRDGMDGILLCMEENSEKILYAAANNSPILISDGHISEMAYDKMPVGKGEKAESFTCFELNYKKGDSLFLYTDGFADQFGGPKGKKFKYKPLNQLLADISTNIKDTQKNSLETVFNNWRGQLEQVDDVCIIGIKL